MPLCIDLAKGYYVSGISAYELTMIYPDEDKEDFYQTFDSIVGSVPRNDELIVLDYFNARVGCDYASWDNVIGHHGDFNTTSNSLPLLSKCVEFNVLITTIVFQQANKHKTSWMYPALQHWHIISYLTVRQRDLHNVMLILIMRDADCWSYHKLVRSQMSFCIVLKQL
ncbi:unnamed protein product [Caretta caretta]